MGTVKYNGQALSVPEVINGRSMRNLFGIPKERTMYSTDNFGQSKVVNDQDRIETNQIQNLGDVPRTEKG